MKAIHAIAFTLVIIGALNWLLVGLGVGDVVSMIFSGAMIVADIIFILVGLSALYLMFTHRKTCKECDKPAAVGSMPM